MFSVYEWYYFPNIVADTKSGHTCGWVKDIDKLIVYFSISNELLAIVIWCQMYIYYQYNIVQLFLFNVLYYAKYTFRNKNGSH